MNVFTSAVMAAPYAATHAQKRQRFSCAAGTSAAMTGFAVIQAKPKQL
jgi:hypothetical protein